MCTKKLSTVCIVLLLSTYYHESSPSVYSNKNPLIFLKHFIQFIQFHILINWKAFHKTRTRRWNFKNVCCRPLVRIIRIQAYELHVSVSLHTVRLIAGRHILTFLLRISAGNINDLNSIR